MTSSVDGLIELQLDALPSERGWAYEATGERSPEERIFHVNDGVLTLDSTGIGYGGACDNTYAKYGALNPGLPFTLRVRAKLIAAEELPENHFGFGFGAEVPTAACDFGLGNGVVQDLSKQDFAVDTSVFHDYRVDCDPIAGQYNFFVDGQLIASNPLQIGAGLNRVLLGDCTCGANARAEVTRFEVEQRIVASQNPIGGTLVSLASPVDPRFRVLRSGSPSENRPKNAKST